MTWNIPAKRNKKLQRLIDRVSNDVELVQLYRCANMNAVDRAGLNDHGEVHVRIVANAALRLLRLLYEADIEPNLVTDYEMTRDDAEVVAFLGAALHDVGIAIHRDDHERHSLVMAYPIGRRLLEGIYDEPQRTIIVSEMLHAVIAHSWEVPCLTIEAGVVKVADALDMTSGRSRIPFESGKVNIHSISAQAISQVSLEQGDELPISVKIALSNSAGIFQIDELLKRKLRHSTLAPYVEVVAEITGETEQRLMGVYRL